MNSPQNQSPVFILGSSGCNGLGVLRCFGRRGIPVYLFNERNSFSHKLSRYCRYIRCPDFNIDDDAAARLIHDFAVKIGNHPVLISTSDRAALYEMRHRNILEKVLRFTSSGEAISQRLLRKDLFWQAAKEANVPHPKTFIPETLIDAQKACAVVGYPAIIKPSVSNVFIRAFRTKCFVVRNCDELALLWPKIASLESPIVIQEIIPGDRLHMWYGYYNRTSNLVASCGYHKIRQYPPRVGSGALVKTLDIQELVEEADRLIRHIGYHGIVEPEFKFDDRDSTWKILEINARTSTQNRLPAVIGCDMEYLAYCEAIGLPLQFCKDGSPHLWTESHCDIVSAIVDPDVSWKEWRSSRKGEKVYANFAWDDPIPALVLLKPASQMIVSALLHRYLPNLYRKLRPNQPVVPAGLELTL